MRLSKSSRRLLAISPGPFHQLQGNHLREVSVWIQEGSEEDIPVRVRTCLLFARAWDSGGFPIVAVSIVPVVVIVKGVECERGRIWGRKWLICAIGMTSIIVLASTGAQVRVVSASTFSKLPEQVLVFMISR